MKTKVAGTGETFWDALLKHIVEKGRRTPKVQVERSIGPILGFFLEQGVSDLLKVKCLLETEPFLESEVVTLAAEFPLKKKDDNQSTNIDWLMYDKKNKKLLLVELKTESTSFKCEQLDIYLNLAAALNLAASVTPVETPWDRMNIDLETICKVSKRRKKYRHAQKALHSIADTCPGIEGASIEVVYLAPESTANSFAEALNEFKTLHPNSALALQGVVRFYSFTNLNEHAGVREDGDFALYRKMLYRALEKLDREDDFGTENSSLTTASNYEGPISLEDVMDLCKNGRSIVVAFQDGPDDLRLQDVMHLESYLYKWKPKDAKNHESPGGENRDHWIDGAEFLTIVEEIRSRRLRSGGDIQQLALGIDKVLRDHPELTLGQLIDQVSRNATLRLDEMSDADLIKALSALPVQK